MAEATTDALAGAARGVALVELNRELVTAAIDGAQGGIRQGARRFRQRRRKFQRPEVPDAAVAAAAARRGGADEVEGARRHGARRRSTTWPAAASTTTSAAASTATAPSAPGPCRTSRRCSTTTPSSARSMPAPTARRRSRSTAASSQQTLGFVGREMTSPDGAFYSALDADTEGEEGKFYVWTAKEIDALLGDEDARVCARRVYGVDDGPNFEKEYHDPRAAEAAEGCGRRLEDDGGRTSKSVLAAGRQKLFDARAKRPRPFLDTKVLTAWNGQMIAGMALAGQALGDKESIAAAARAADFVLKNLRNQGRPAAAHLRRRAGPEGGGPAQRLPRRLRLLRPRPAHPARRRPATKRWLDEARA